VTANATAAVLAAAEFVLQANSSAGFTVQDRVGLIVRNEIQNGTLKRHGTHVGTPCQARHGKLQRRRSNTYGLVIDHTLDANVAAARLVSPRAFIALKEQAGAAGNTTLYLMEVGAQGNLVSANLSTGNASVLFTKAANATVPTHKLRVNVDGTDYWLCLTSAF
jgi:hypothetical protein